MISREEVEKLAVLSRLTLNEEEKKKFEKEIGSILAYVAQIQEAVSEGAGILPQTDTVLRHDGPSHESGLFTEKILSLAPRREGNYIAVKKILS